MATKSKVCAIGIALISAAIAPGCDDDDNDFTGGEIPPPDGGNQLGCFAQVNEVSNIQGVGTRVDPDLVNSWGLVARDGLFWIADNGTGKVSIFDGAGTPATTPVASGSITLVTGLTGVASNNTDSFVIPCTENCGPAKLIFATEGGQLIAVDPAVSLQGTTVVDQSGEGADFRGVAIVENENNGPLLLAADFANNQVDVFDGNFRLVSSTRFDDPDRAAGLQPFNVAAFGDRVFVTFAQFDPQTGDEVKGAGLGQVTAFDTSGNVVWRATSDLFNAPWGMAIAPDTLTGLDGFDGFQGALLVGNFGDGHITVVGLENGTVIAQLVNSDGTPFAIDGLWGIAFGDDVANADPNALFFAAGPADETQGLFGVLEPTCQPTNNDGEDQDRQLVTR